MPGLLGSCSRSRALLGLHCPRPTMGPVIAYFDCFSGVSGDMALGALLDAGLPLDALRTQLTAVDLQGYRLEAREQTDGAIKGTRLEVVVDEEQPVRRLGDIVRLLDSGR